MASAWPVGSRKRRPRRDVLVRPFITRAGLEHELDSFLADIRSEAPWIIDHAF